MLQLPCSYRVKHNGVKIMNVPTECCSFQLLTSVETVSELQETHVIFCDLIDKMPRGTQLTEGELVVVLVVQYIHQRRQEWMQVLQASR